MKVIDTALPEIKIIQPQRHFDERGFFSEVFSRRVWAESGLLCDFVQDNYSLSQQAGVVRGFHFQIPPFAQTKLVRVLRGSIFDVAIDIRHGSRNFGRLVSAVLSAENWNQILIPKGFAHAFCTLEPETEVLYKVDNYYSREHDRGLLWNDRDIAVDWPVDEANAILSPRDRDHPPLAQLPRYFDANPDGGGEPWEVASLAPAIRARATEDAAPAGAAEHAP